MSSVTATASPDIVTADPSKHVRFTHGMILGADDFDQEFAWLSGRDRWLARDALGYGTLNGLRVQIHGPASDPEVLVSRGTALTPRGDLVRVTSAQCAKINNWLTKHRDNLVTTSPPEPTSLFVVLCYDTCDTDARPIPGEPCRDEADTMAAARVQDAFHLELRLQPPNHDEERGVRLFVRWLRDAIEFVDGASTGSVADFVDLLRASAPRRADETDDATTSPPSSPPAALFNIERGEACAYLRAALRVWVTELRPQWKDEFGNHGCKAPAEEPQAVEECLLLAELRITLDENNRAGDVEIVETRRPILGHMRMLQEWATCGPSEAGGERGPEGPPGRDGADGRDGVDGADGRDGVDGAPGRDGVDGAPGRDGVDGAPGRDGVDGAPGRNGADGAPGRDGVNGAPGRDGVDGAPGRDGEPGPTDPTLLQGLFVELPKSEMRYFIVAAGIVRLEPANARQPRVRQPVFNGLRIVRVDPSGMVLLHYNDYDNPENPQRSPKESFQLIVKAMVVWSDMREQMVVTFDRFIDEGITVRVNTADGSANFESDAARRRLELVVEISRYEFRRNQ